MGVVRAIGWVPKFDRVIHLIWVRFLADQHSGETLLVLNREVSLYSHENYLNEVFGKTTAQESEKSASS